MQLDTLDWRILTALQDNGRLSNQDLAERVALSPSACLRRVRALEDAGLIAGYHARLDAVRLGFELNAIVHVTLDHSQQGWHETFQAEVMAFDEVSAAHVVTGSCNYILQIRAANLAAFSDFMVNRLNKLPGMRDMCSYIIMKTLKDHGGRLPLR